MKKIILLCVLIALLLVSFAGCGKNLAKAVESVENGMSKQEVIKLLGDDYKEEYYEATDTTFMAWKISDEEGVIVILEGGKVDDAGIEKEEWDYFLEEMF